MIKHPILNINVNWAGPSLTNAIAFVWESIKCSIQRLHSTLKLETIISLKVNPVG